MKKFATLAASALIFVCCAAFLSGCGGNEDKHSDVDPGTYLFEKSACTSFIDYKVEGAGNHKYDFVQTSTEITLTVSPKRYYWREFKDIFETKYQDLAVYRFDDCSMTFEFEVNGQKYTRSFYLDSDGKHEETFTFTFEPTYSLKTKCTLVGTEGEVYAPMRDGYAFDYDGMSYVTKARSDTFICELDSSCYKNQKNLIFHSFVSTPEGEELRFSLGSILANRLIFNFFDFNLKMTHTKTICLKGTYHIDDLNTVFTSLREYFPNLEKFAIENLADDGSACGTCAFPEKGITFYLSDIDSVFAQSLRGTYFVNGVQPYSEFSEA